MHPFPGKLMTSFLFVHSLIKFHLTHRFFTVKLSHEQTPGSGFSIRLRTESSKWLSVHFSYYSLTSAHTVNTSRIINPVIKTRKLIPAWLLCCLISFSPSLLALSQGSQQERDLWAQGSEPVGSPNSWVRESTNGKQALTSYIKNTLAPTYIPMRTTARTAAFIPVEGTGAVVNRELDARPPRPGSTA